MVTDTKRDSFAAVVSGKNTCDLRRRLYFARLDARIVLPVITYARAILTCRELQSKLLRSFTEQILSNLRAARAWYNAQMLCKSLAAIIQNLLHKLLLWL